MKFFKKSAVISAVITGLAVPVSVYATNGAWMIGYGAKSRSMGGTGVADNRGGMAAAYNPAGMVDSGNRFDMGADLFVPPRSAKHESTRLGYTNEESSRDIFLIPSMGLTYQVNDKFAAGFAFIGAGLKTEYNQSVNSSSCKAVNKGNIAGYAPGQCPATFFNALNNTASPEVGVELIQMQMLPSIAYKINKQHSVGATIAIGANFFRAEGLQDFGSGPGQLGFTTSEGDFTSGNWDQAFGMGYRLGYQGKFMEDRLRFGLNYSSRVWMKKLHGYRNLFAEQGGFDIPESYAAGIAYDFTPAITTTFDVQEIKWSDVRSIGNPGPDASNPNNLLPLCPVGTDQSTCLLGGVNGLGFGWKDQTVYKVGANWNIDEKWRARIGWNYGKSPIRKDQVLFNMLAPATPEHHFTIGGGYEYSENIVLDASFVYAFSNTIKGPTAFGPGGAIVEGENASINMVQYSIGGAIGIKF